MEKADTIVYGRYVVTLDQTNQVIPRGAVVVRDGVIIDVGEEGDIRSRYEAEEVIERRDHVVIPGLVDCHTHTQQYLLRSAINDEMLQLPPVWTKVLVPFERIMGEDLARLSSKASIINMLKNGITYFVEAGAPYPEILAEEVLASGIKGVVTYATYDIAEEKIAEPEEVLKKVERLYDTYGGRKTNLRVWASLRQVMMVSEELMEGVIKLSKEYGLGLTLHLGEYQGEVDYTLAKYGLRPLEYLIKCGIRGIKPVVIAHGVYFSPMEVRILKEYELGLCWCPSVDSWLMGIHWVGLTNVEDLKLGIGSDGGAWGRIDLLHEAKIAKALSKAVSTSITYFKAGLDSNTLLKMLTGSMGSLVGEKIGRLKKGYAADITILNMKNVKNLPIHDPVNTIINYLEGDNVTDVIVDGRLIVENGRVKTLNEEKVLEELLDREEEIKGKFVKLAKQLKMKL
ncbi:MAG: amidohydrolase family protein [Desulfurococcaceae archaeon TW002]